MTIKKVAVYATAGASLVAILAGLGLSDARPTLMFETKALIVSTDTIHAQLAAIHEQLASNDKHNEKDDLKQELEWRTYMLAVNDSERRRYEADGISVPASNITVRDYLQARIAEINRLLGAFQHDSDD